MNNKSERKILTAFIAIYLASFLIINWNDVSWIFNYKEVSGLVHNFFYPYGSSQVFENASRVPFPTIPAENINAKNPENISSVKFSYSGQADTVEIPSLSISAPIVYPGTTDTEILKNYLDAGVIYYPGSVTPEQAGKILILGHSAPVNWPKIKYDWVFSRLNNLEPGDLIFITINHKKYAYSVFQKEIIDIGQKINFTNPSDKKNVLVLISCWPPGKDLKRIAVASSLSD